MRTRFLSFPHSILFAAIFLAASGQPLDTTGLAWERIQSGEIIVSSIKLPDGLQGTQSIFSINAQPKAIWDLITNYTVYAAICQDVEKLDVLWSTADSALVRVHTKPVVFRKFVYDLHRTYSSGTWQLDWKRVHGDMKRVEGSWKLLEAPQIKRTLVIHTSFVSIGDPICDLLVPAVAPGSVKKTDERLRRFAEKIVR